MWKFNENEEHNLDDDEDDPIDLDADDINEDDIEPISIMGLTNATASQHHQLEDDDCLGSVADKTVSKVDLDPRYAQTKAII